MTSSTFLVIFVLLFVNSVFGNSCGGLLEGERGHFSLPIASNQEEYGAPRSSCLWIIQLHYENNVQFTLDALDEDSHLNLYPEDQLTACNANGYTKLNAQHIGSSFEFPGKTLIIVLPNSSASVAFSWDFFNIKRNNNYSTVMKNSDHVSSSHGQLEWEQLEPEERVTWVINPSASFDITWNLDTRNSCGANLNCACVHFAIFLLTSEGALNEAVRSCGQSSEGQLKGLSGRFVVLIKVNTTKIQANKISVSWTRVTSVPPVPASTGLFAATEAGLIALDLQTLQATAVTSEYACTVAVNHNLEKVYWSEIFGNSRIMRSNFDGSSKETVVPQTGASIFTLAVHEPSGNFYYSLHDSHEILVCNSLGKNCQVIVSDSSLVDYPGPITLDSENELLYWGRYGSPSVLVRANLDGSNAAIVSSGFKFLNGIVLEKPSSQVIYWVDYWENTVGTIDINGGNKRILVELAGNPGTLGIEVYADKIYFSNFFSGNIQSLDRYSGTELTTIFNATGGVRYLTLFNAPTQ